MAKKGASKPQCTPFSGQKACLFDVEVAVVLPALRVEAVHAETVKRNGLRQLLGITNEVPKLGWRVCMAEEATSRPDDGDFRATSSFGIHRDGRESTRMPRKR